jgi:hypothetical protein
MFEVHILNATGKENARYLQDAFKSFLGALEETCGKDGREMAIVRTKLEEASFYAKRAMAMRPEHHDGVSL